MPNRTTIGGGWRVVHLTDRVIELRKEDAAYRAMVGRDGYVLVRAEPGMSRDALVNAAVRRAQENDAAIAERVAKRLMPKHVTRYHDKQRQLAGAFGVPGEEPSERIYRP